MSSTVQGKTKSRRSDWVAEHPDAGPLFYLWEWLTEFGVIIGGREITFVDVKAWSDLTHVRVTPDESRALCELSRIWFSEYRKGASADAMPPWLPEE